MSHEVVACIVGLSNDCRELFGTRPGVGKSCLCFRLAYPGFDNYVDNHPSLFALHEFESPAINSCHFLYWGSPVKFYPVRGGDLSVQFHIIEQTVFYQDITSLPFNHTITKPNQVENYIKRIIGPMESRGKVSYYSRDGLVTGPPAEYARMDYPQGITRISRGFVVVFDVSLTGKDLDMQCKRLEPILQYLTKHKKKFIIAVTKRDCYSIPSLEKAYELRKKYRTHLVECSASENLNTEEVLRILAQIVLSKKVSGLSDQVIHYHDAAQHALTERGSAKRSFKSFVQKKVLDSDERLSSIQLTEEYKECACWIGVQRTGSVFALHVLELYNVKVDRYAGAMENPDMRQEFLEDFVDQRNDISDYRSEMRRWISNYIKKLPKQEVQPDTEPAELVEYTELVDYAELDPIDSSENTVYINQTDPADNTTDNTNVIDTTNTTKPAQEPEGYHIFESVSKVAKDSAQQGETLSGVEESQCNIETTQQEAAAVNKRNLSNSTEGAAEPEVEPTNATAEDDSDGDSVSEYSSASMESVSDHDYLNFDPKNPCVYDAPADDTPTSHKQVTDPQGDLNCDPVRELSPEVDYENMIGYSPELDYENIATLAQNVPPRGLPVCPSDNVEGNGAQADVNEDKNNTEITDGTVETRAEMAETGNAKLDAREDTVGPETKAKEEVVAVVELSQSHASTTSPPAQNLQVEQTSTHGSPLAPKVSPKPSMRHKKIQTALPSLSFESTPPFVLPSEATRNNGSPKMKPPTPIRKSSLKVSSTSPSPILDQLPSQNPPTKILQVMEASPGRQVTSTGQREEPLERAVCSSSVAVDLTDSERTDVVEASRDPSDTTTGLLASGETSNHGSRHSNSPSPIHSKKPCPKVTFPRSTDTENPELPVIRTPGKTNVLSATESVGGRNNDQVVQDKSQEVKSLTTTITPTSPSLASPSNLDSAVASSANQQHRPRLTLIRKKIAKRKDFEIVSEFRKPDVSPRQATNKEGRPKLADIKKRLNVIGDDDKILQPQLAQLPEPSPEGKKVTENIDKGFENKVIPMHVISHPGPPSPIRKLPSPIRKLDLPPLPSKSHNIARKGNAAAARGENKEQPATRFEAGRLGMTRGKNEDEEGEVATTSPPPPPLPCRTEAMFEVRQAPPDASVRANTYLNVLLKKDSDVASTKAEASVTATTSSTKVEEVEKSGGKKKKGFYPFNRLKQEVVDQVNKKRQSVDFGDQKEQVSPTKKSLFMLSPIRKKDQAVQQKKTEPQAVETRAKFVVMNERPLPAIPGQSCDPNIAPDHAEDDYEDFTFDDVEVNYENYPQLPKQVMTGGRGERSRSQEPMESRSAPSTPRLAIKSSRQENASRPVPARQISAECPDYIDGYVNADHLPIHHDPIGRRPLPVLPFSSKNRSSGDEYKEDELEYEYPDLRLMGAFSSLHARQATLARLEKLKKLREPLSAACSSDKWSVGTVGEVGSRDTLHDKLFRDRSWSTASSTYVPMASGAFDDMYVNSDIVQSSLSDRELPSRGLRRSASDQNIMAGAGTKEEEVEDGKEDVDEAFLVYMNLPTPEPSTQLPPRHKSVHAPESPHTPTRSRMSEKVFSLDEGSSIGPPVKPKPFKKRAASIAATSTHLIPGMTEHPQQGWHSNSACPSQCSSPSGEVKGNNETTASLPPRNIPRESLV